MKCVNCGKEIAEESRFCPICGAQQIEEQTSINDSVDDSVEDSAAEAAAEAAGDESEAEESAVSAGSESSDEQASESMNQENTESPVQYCPFCGAKNPEDAVFCEVCGKNMKSKPKGHSILIKAVAGVLAVAAVGLAIFAVKTFVPVKKASSNMFIYAEDDSLYMANAKKPKEEAVELEGDYGQELMYYLDRTAFTPDGKYVCYPSVIEEEYGNYKLYMKKLNSKDKAVKIASDVSDFRLLDNGKVVYQTNETLYISDYSGDKKKVGTGNGYWKITEDQRYLVWTGQYDEDANTYDGLYYIDTELKQEKKKLASNVSYAFSMSANGEKIFFLDDDYLFVVENFGEKKKIASGVDSVPVMDSKGNAFYLKDNEDKTFYDLVEDDITDEGNMPYPSEADFVHDVQETNYWTGEQYTVTETDWDAYYAAVDQYNAYQQIFTIRNFLQDPETSEYNLKQFCMYSNGAEKVLEPDAIFTNYGYISDPVAGYYVKGENPVASISDLWSDLTNTSSSSGLDAYQVRSALMKRVADNCTYKFCGENGSVELNESLDGVFCTESKKVGYGWKVVDSYTDIYTFALSGEDAGNCRLYAEDLYLFDNISDIMHIDHDDIYYYADIDKNNYTASLFVNQVEIASDVRSDMGRMTIDNGVVYYPSEMNKDYSSYTLCKYDGKSSKEIAEDVSFYHAFGPNCIAMITDYSSDRKKGTLSVYDGKEVINLSDDVQAIS